MPMIEKRHCYMQDICDVPSACVAAELLDCAVSQQFLGAKRLLSRGNKPPQLPW